MNEPQLTNENAEQMFALELGYAIMGIIYGCEQLRHVTLSGHLHYQHADQTHPESVGGGLVQWLRWITAWGEEKRNEIGKPQQLIDLCVTIKHRHLSELFKN